MSLWCLKHYKRITKLFMIENIKNGMLVRGIIYNKGVLTYTIIHALHACKHYVLAHIFKESCS